MPTSLKKCAKKQVNTYLSRNKHGMHLIRWQDNLTRRSSGADLEVSRIN